MIQFSHVIIPQYFSLLGLFRYNYPKARIFMGDSGSLFLGYSLSAMAIMLTQGQGKVNPMIPAIVLGVPIFDTLRVMITRFINKKHPFKPDKIHLHHLMIRSGIQPTRVVKIIWILSLLLSLLAFALYNYESWSMLLVLLIFITLLGILIENLRILKIKRA